MDEETLDQKLLDCIKSLEKEVMDYEEMDDDNQELNQQLSVICKSLENEVSNSQKMEKSALIQQPSDRIQSLQDEVSNNHKMDKSALIQQQRDRIKSLLDEGLVDCYFRQSYSLKEDVRPSFFLDLVPSFLCDARNVMREMATVLESPVVDFDVLNEHCIKLKGGSSCIGACKVANVCYDFIRAIDKKSKDECLQAFRNFTREYHDLQSKLESIMQLEREILSAESSKSVIGEQ